MIKINLSVYCDYNMYIFIGYSKLNVVKIIFVMLKYCIEIDLIFLVLRIYRVFI